MHGRQKACWIALPRGGTPVGKGPFIPCKPPLRSTANEGLDEGDRCSPCMFLFACLRCRLLLAMCVLFLLQT